MPTPHPLTHEQFDGYCNISELVSNRLSAINWCLENELFAETLILLYSLIDNMASLDPESSKQFVDSKSFLSWADKYILARNILSCTALDLYAARCGIIHGFRTEARLVYEGKARPLWYAFPPFDAPTRQLEIDTFFKNTSSVPERIPLAVEFRTLLDEVKEGIKLFIQEVQQDSVRFAVFLSRGQSLLNSLQPQNTPINR